ncbi:MAG: hypothetical protein HPY53_08020 [Brevinematales bacterium]|nr:hypothetical protein [Brevinematales bacterium]
MSKILSRISAIAVIVLMAATAASAKMLTYKDKAGFQFDYPDDWTVSSDDSVGVPNITYSSADGMAAFGVYVYPMNDKKMTALGLLNGTLDSLEAENTLPKDQITPPSAEIKAAGATDGAIALIETQQGNYNMAVGICILVKGKKYYMYVQSVVKDSSKGYSGNLSKMAKSFRITAK